MKDGDDMDPVGGRPPTATWMTHARGVANR